MFKVTLSQFPQVDTERRVWQVFVGGLPITRELESEEQAMATALRTYREHSGRAELYSWDGFVAVESLLESR